MTVFQSSYPARPPETQGFTALSKPAERFEPFPPACFG